MERQTDMPDIWGGERKRCEERQVERETGKRNRDGGES